MAEHNLFYYPYASFTDAQLPLLKVAAAWFDKQVILDPLGARGDTISAQGLLGWRAAGKAYRRTGCTIC